jgi:tripartite-type tricarboxylate transporter receptor subunit TctC
VRLVVGFPAGGTNDIHARLIADWLSKQFGRSFIVENRPGAAGNIGLESVVRAAPDGYTLGVCGSTELRNEILYTDLKFSFMHDTAPVASMMLAMNVLVVHPAFSVKSVPDLIAAAKANPDAMTVGSAGVGSTSHVFWELFRSMRTSPEGQRLGAREALGYTSLLSLQPRCSASSCRPQGRLSFATGRPFGRPR